MSRLAFEKVVEKNNRFEITIGLCKEFMNLCCSLHIFNPYTLLLWILYNCEFFTFPFGILGQVWYLIVSIPDLCTLTYFVFFFTFHNVGMRHLQRYKRDWWSIAY